MRLQAGRTLIELDFYAVAAAAAFLILDRSGFGQALLWALIAHEAGHLALLLRWRARIVSCTVGIFGVRIHTAPGALSPGRSLCVVAAGCAVNAAAAALCLLWHSADALLFSAANAALAALNLLPVQGSDGGVLCRALCIRLLGETRGRQADTALATACTVLLLAAALSIALLRRRWLWGAAATLFLLLRLFAREVE